MCKKTVVVLVSLIVLSQLYLTVISGENINADFVVSANNNESTQSVVLDRNIKNQDGIVNVPDKNLKAAINEQLRKPYNADITEDEMKMIISLSAENKGISDVTGLEYATGLRYLYLKNNSITDISPLKNLNLSELVLTNNQVVDATPLMEKRFEHLFLSNNNISNLSPFKDIRAYKLDLSNNGISDISHLNLQNTQYLKLENNQISDISILKNEPFRGLSLYGNQISDISVLSSVSFNSGYLNLGSNNLANADLSPIYQGSKSYSYLNLSDNNLTNVDLLTNIRTLRYLDISHNNLKNIDSIWRISNLEYVVANDNQITNVNFQDNKYYSFLQLIDLSNNQIKDITTIKYIENINRLSLENNQLEDISPLNNTKVDEAYLANNQIKFSEENTVPKVRIIDLSLNNLEEIFIPKYSTIDRFKFDYLNLSRNNLGKINSIIENQSILNSLDVSYNRNLDVSSVQGDESLLRFLNINSTNEKVLNQILSLNYSPSSRLHVENMDLTNEHAEYFSKPHINNVVHHLGLDNNHISDLRMFGDYAPLYSQAVLYIFRYYPYFFDDFFFDENELNYDVYFNQKVIDDYTAKNQLIDLGEITVDTDEPITFSVYDQFDNEIVVDLGIPDLGENEMSGEWVASYIMEGDLSFTGKVVANVNYEPFGADELAVTSEEIPLTDKELIKLFNVKGTRDEQVYVDQSTVNYSVPNEYQVTFSLNQDEIVHSKLKVEDKLPKIELEKTEHAVMLGSDPIDYLAEYGVKASEITENDMINEVQINDENVNYQQVGTYSVTFKIIDEEGNEAIEEVKLIVEPKPSVTKSVVDEDADGYLSLKETALYSIKVTNLSDKISAENIELRDSLIENTPEWLVFNDNVTVKGDGINTTGNLKYANYMISEIKPGQTVELVYTMTLNSVPEDREYITNIAAVNGTSVETCEQDNSNCNVASIPIDGETIIDVKMSDANGNEIVENGEQVNVEVTIKNTNMAVKNNVHVRSFLLENLPDWIEIIGSPEPRTLQTSGSLMDGDFRIKMIPGNSEVVINYDLKVKQIPKSIGGVEEIVTTNGTLNWTIDSNESSRDEMITDGSTKIKKTVTDATGDEKVAVGETLNYRIEITNNSVSIARNVSVRDSMLESVFSYITLNNDYQINADFSGDLTAGNLTINEIAPGKSVVITYSGVLNQVPEKQTSVVNVVSNSGLIPSECSENDETCAKTDTPVLIQPSLKKTVTETNGDGLVKRGETLNYQIEVTNPSQVATIKDIAVRDNLLENIPYYLVYNNDLEVESTTNTTGDLLKGDMLIKQLDPGQKITINYSLHLKKTPDYISKITNTVTTTGEIVQTCENDSITCSSTETLVKPDTLIEKNVIDADSDGYATMDEKLTYTIKVTNPNKHNNAINVKVRDNLLENLPSWLTYNNDMMSNVAKEKITGDLTLGNLVIPTIEPMQTIELTYSLKLNAIPQANSSIINIATDNGSLTDGCLNSGVDCSSAVIPIDGATEVEKFVIDSNENYLAEVGETLSYTVKIKNGNEAVKNNVAVRDSLIEEVPEWLTFDDNIEIKGDVITSGNMKNGDLIIDSIPGNSKVIITYSFTVQELPKNVSEITNIATDDGSIYCTEKDEYCDRVSIATEGYATITKVVADEDGDGIATLNELLNYTITIENNSATPAHDINIRDSILENLPEYVMYNDDMTINSQVITSGDLLSGDFMIQRLNVGEKVEIHYSLSLNEKAEELTELINIATDNGILSDFCHENDEGCSLAVIKVNVEIPEPEKPDVPEPEKPDVPEPEKPDIPEPEKPDVPEPEKPDIPKVEEPEVSNPENNEGSNSSESNEDNFGSLNDTSKDNALKVLIILYCMVIILVIARIIFKIVEESDLKNISHK